MQRLGVRDNIDKHRRFVGCRLLFTAETGLIRFSLPAIRSIDCLRLPLWGPYMTLHILQTSGGAMSAGVFLVNLYKLVNRMSTKVPTEYIRDQTGLRRAALRGQLFNKLVVYRRMEAGKKYDERSPDGLQRDRSARISALRGEDGIDITGLCEVYSTTGSQRS